MKPMKKSDEQHQKIVIHNYELYSLNHKPSLRQSQMHFTSLAVKAESNAILIVYQK